MENLSLGLEVMIVGFAVVMATLFLLYLVLVVFGRCCAVPAKEEQPRKNVAAVPPAALQEAQSAPVAAAVSPEPSGIAPDIVAAITAAISVCMQASASQFEIVSMQPARAAVDGSHWAVAGRKRLMEKRQDLAMFRRERR